MPGLRVALCAVAVGVGCGGRASGWPPSPRWTAPATRTSPGWPALVAPRLPPGGRVAVGDAGAGTADTQLLDTEEFIGLVNALDRAGFQPTVNAFWKAQFGPGYLADGTEPRQVSLVHLDGGHRVGRPATWAASATWPSS